MNPGAGRSRRGPADPIPRSERGSAMLAALCFAIVFTIVLSSFAALTYTSLKVSTRNLMGVHALEAAESGLELALYAQNYQTTPWPGWTASATTATINLTLTSNGLALAATNPTPLNLSNGMTAQVALSVTGIGTGAPTFTSTASVSLPNNPVPVTRTLTAIGGVSPMFVNAVAATRGSTIFAAGTVDSYDSTQGPYPGLAATNFAAVVMSQNAADNSVSISTANIKGFVAGYSPSNPASDPWFSYGGAGSVIGQATPAATTIDSSRVITNPLPYQPQFAENLHPSPLAPPTVNLAISGATVVTLGTPGATIPSVYSVVGDINITGTAQLKITGPVVLLLNGNFYLNPNPGDAGQIAFIDSILTNNASLEVHMTDVGANLKINGTTGTGITNQNANPYPKRFAIIGPSVYYSGGSTGIAIISSVPATTSSQFVGCIYLPNAGLTFNGNVQVYGSVIAGSCAFTGAAPAVHYDLSLRRSDSLYVDAAYDGFLAPISLGTITPTPFP